MDNNFIRYNLGSKGNILIWKALLANYSLEAINQQFENYKTCCIFYKTNFNRIENNINSLLKISYNGHDFSPDFKYSIDAPNIHSNFPNYLFRIRKMTKGSWFEFNSTGLNFDTMEFEEIQCLKDVWERPADQVKDYQRLNKPFSSVLYTSLMSSTAVLETNLEEKDLFFLIVYKSTGNFKYSDCCKFVYFNELSEEENMKRYIMFCFLRDEFTRILPGSYKEGNQYCSSYHISKQFFISDDVHGIQYPSTRGLGHRNFAFWGNVRDYLTFVGFRFCMLMKKEGTQSEINVIADSFWDNKKNKFIYTSPYSDKSKQVFDDFFRIMMCK